MTNVIALADRRRQFKIGDMVGLWGGPKHINYDGDDYGTVLDHIAADSTDERVSEAEGTGPLYLVNVGNVFGHGGMYEHVFAESELAPVGTLGEPYSPSCTGCAEDGGICAAHALAEAEKGDPGPVPSDLCGSCGVAASACSWSQNPSAGRGDCCPTCNHVDDF